MLNFRIKHSYSVSKRVYNQAREKVSRKEQFRLRVKSFGI